MRHCIVSLACFQQFSCHLSSAIYTIEKIPTQHKNFYHVTYELQDPNILLQDTGILTETITPQNPDHLYSLDYIYQPYHRKTSELAPSPDLELKHHLTADQSFGILGYNDCHPILFYLHAIRKGLKTELPDIGTKWSALIPDNHHTYLTTTDALFNGKQVKVDYKLKNISSIQTFDNEFLKLYTFSWRAISKWNIYSRRQGEITILQNGTIYSLLVKLPEQLRGFSLKDESKLSRSTTLLIQKINEPMTYLIHSNSESEAN